MKKIPLKTNPSSPTAVPRGITISSLDQLESRCRSVFHATFTLSGEEIRVPVHRLSPRTQEKINAIAREAVPPMKRTLKGDMEPDFQAAEYVALTDKLHRIQRAVMVYEGCPIVREAKPGLTDRDAIAAYVEELFTENIVQLIYLAIISGGMEVVKLTDFTSAAGSGD